MRLALLLLLALGACRQETGQPFGGSPCGPDRPCPDGMICHPALEVCGVIAPDAPEAPGPPDAAPVADGAPDDAA